MTRSLLTTDPFNFDIVPSTRLDSACALAMIKAVLGTPLRPRKPCIRPPDGLRTEAEAAAKLGISIRTLGHMTASD